jgi:hypothetical protein
MQIKQDMEYAIQQAEQKLNALQIAYNALEQADEGLDEGNGNSGFSGQGRGSTDDQSNNGQQEFTPADLNEFLKTGARSDVDGSYDLRTREGRALEVAGWIDTEGFPITGRGRIFPSEHQTAGR